MWLSFFTVFLAGIVILYLPGSLFFWACGAPLHYALIAAPMFSLVSYEIVAAILPFAAIEASFVTVFIPVFFLSLLIVLISLLHRRRTNTHHRKISPSEPIGTYFFAKQEVVTLCLYIAVGLIATIFIFVKSLDGPCSFVQTYDNLHHFALARSYIESGIWSPLQTIPYIEGNDGFFNPVPTMSYYPTAWSLLVALLSCATTSPLPMSANAINALFCAIVFPGSMYLLMKCIFPSRTKIILCGSLLVMAFSVFPWDILMVFPLLPNMASMALAPIFIVAFMRLVSLDASKKERFVQLLLLVCSVATFFFMHPNSVFTGALFLIPFCAYQVGQIATHYADVSCTTGIFHNVDGSHCADTSHVRFYHIVLYKIVPACLFIAFALAVWYLLFKLPFLQSTVQYIRLSSADTLKTVFDILTLRFTLNSSQIMLAGIVCIGFVAILRMTQYIWLDCSFILTACFYFSSSALGDAAINHFLTGFWYTDPHRVGAVMVLSAIPLAAAGLAAVFNFVKNRLNSVCETPKNRNTQTMSIVSRKLIAKIPYSVVIICALLCYLPSIAIRGGHRCISLP